MITLADLLSRYRPEMRPLLRWSASREYWLDALDREPGTASLAGITTPGLAAWAAASPRSPQCKRAILATLCAVARSGHDLYGAPCDPACITAALRALEHQRIIARSGRRARRISDPELARIAAAWSGTTAPEIVPVLIDTALRSGELARLEWRDIDLDARTAYIRARKHPRERHNNHQTIPLLGRSAAIIAARPRDHARPFPFPRRTISLAFTRAAARAGVADARLHDLRHEGISRLFEAGWTIPQVAAVSGHRSWSQLRAYTHITPQQLHQLGKAA